MDIDHCCTSAQLQTLSMARNKINSVPTRPLRPLHQLITLHLNDNNITRLNHDTFYEYGEHLQNLWLQNNKISVIEPECFEQLTTLEWLKLNNNEMRSLPYQLMEPVLSSLKYIDIYSEYNMTGIYQVTRPDNLGEKISNINVSYLLLYARGQIEKSVEILIIHCTIIDRFRKIIQ